MDDDHAPEESTDIVPQEVNLADRIADSVLTKFASLPAKYKPSRDTSEVHNWVPLSGIVLEHQDGSLDCVTLATGMKCLPTTKIRLAQGRLLHDSHAEILALRAFNHFILQECANMVGNQDEGSRYIIKATVGSVPFTIRPVLKIHMYCSEAPCGDASMELVMQKQADATPWTDPVPSQGLLGRGNFSELGIVRRKPGKLAYSLVSICSYNLLKLAATVRSHCPNLAQISWHLNNVHRFCHPIHRYSLCQIMHT